MDQITLYQARWIVPVSRPPIEQGIIAVRNGEITAVGRGKEISTAFPGERRDLGQGAILPGLINAHTHVELSQFKGLIPEGLGFVSWVRNLLSLKEKTKAENPDEAVGPAWDEISRTGTCAAGDWISLGRLIPRGSLSKIFRRLFFEVIGFDSSALTLPEGLDERPAPDLFGSLTLGAHAPHSTSAALLQAAKTWTRRRGLPLAVHVAESPEETEFLFSGSGLWKDFLIERGKWVEGWRAPGTTPVKYLDHLGLLDEKTLAVHLTQADEADLSLLRKRNVRIAVCPRSNQFIVGALPKIPFMLRMGLNPALSTDSLASNRDLSLWGEMETVQQAFPEIEPEEIIRMATINGASALDLSEELGDLTPGKKARMFFLPLPEVNKANLLSAIIQSRGHGLEWVS